MLSDLYEEMKILMQMGYSGQDMLNAQVTKQYDAQWGDPTEFVLETYRGLWAIQGGTMALRAVGKRSKTCSTADSIFHSTSRAPRAAGARRYSRRFSPCSPPAALWHRK